MSTAAFPARDSLSIYGDYNGTRIDAEFSFRDKSVRVRSGHLAGETYTSLTKAAEAVVGHLNPGREYVQTNGRLFWRVQDTGQPIRSVLGKR